MYDITYTSRANLAVQKIVLWWAEHRDPEQAQRWLTGFKAAIAELKENPQRFAVARENAFFDTTLRELHFGLSGSPTHRAVYEVRESKVIIHAVRHVAQQDLTSDDL